MMGLFNSTALITKQLLGKPSLVQNIYQKTLVSIKIQTLELYIQKDIHKTLFYLRYKLLIHLFLTFTGNKNISMVCEKNLNFRRGGWSYEKSLPWGVLIFSETTQLEIFERKKKQSMNLLIQLKKYIILTSAVEGGMPAY